MCVIAISRKTNMKMDTLRKMMDANPDGWGFAYVNRGTLHVKKRATGWRSFKKAWKRIPNTAEVVVHFRIATHGRVDDNNCHPFVLSDRRGRPLAALFHNGTISGLGDPKGKGRSDTSEFVSEWLQPLVDKYGLAILNDDNPMRKFIEHRTGASRIAVLTRQGEIIRWGRWHEEGEILVSNLNWKKPANEWKKITAVGSFDDAWWNYYTPGMQTPTSTWYARVAEANNAKHDVASSTDEIDKIVERGENTDAGDTFTALNHAVDVGEGFYCACDTCTKWRDAVGLTDIDVADANFRIAAEHALDSYGRGEAQCLCDACIDLTGLTPLGEAVRKLLREGWEW